MVAVTGFLIFFASTDSSQCHVSHEVELQFYVFCRSLAFGALALFKLPQFYVVDGTH